MADNDRHVSGPVRTLIQVVLIYVLLALLVFVIGEYVPWFRDVIFAPQNVTAGSGQGFLGQPQQTTPIVTIPAVNMLGLSLAAMAMSFFLLLPVVVVFTATRSKKGYRQAMVQTLVILPTVVAGVIILVKNNLALAFSLGGVVGAVSFRNRLDDPKDAVYVFLSIAVGLACGVQAYPIAFALSLFYNVLILGLWYSDFGRMPAELSRAIAERRVQAAKGVVGDEGRQSPEFLSLLDRQVLRSMTPDQLGLLADRALRQRHKVAKDVLEVESRFDTTLKITVPEQSAPDVRSAIEVVLYRDAKEWEFDEAASPVQGGRQVLHYRVRLRKKVPMPLLLESVRRAALPHAEQVTFE